MIAAKAGNLKATKMLIEHGADIHHQTEDRRDALWVASLIKLHTLCSFVSRNKQNQAIIPKIKPPKMKTVLLIIINVFHS